MVGETASLEPSPLQTEAVIEALNTTVQVAEIEANRDITIAAIHAETEVAHIEARQEENEAWLRERLASVEAENNLLRTQVETLTPLEPSTLVEAIATEVVEAIQEEVQAEATTSPLTPIATSLETEPTQTEVIAESGSEVVVQAPIPERRKPLIQLV